MSKKRNIILLALWTAWLMLVVAACEPLTTLPQTPTASGGVITQPAGTDPAHAIDDPLTVVPTETAKATEPPPPSPTPLEVIRFVVIGDYGLGTQPEADVAALVKGWNPDFIITVGDNNYPIGSAETIDDRIGRFFHEYIYPYRGAFGQGADELRFFPTLGNHDYDTPGAQPFFDYFELPGNERYYSFTKGSVFFLALNSDSREPDGVSPISPQAQWAQTQLEASNAPWKLVYFHASPYTSGYHDPVDWMRWDFAAWGASVVLSGHNHAYERLLIDGLTYIVNGSGGGPIYDFMRNAEGTQFRYNEDHGAILGTADAQTLTLEFFNTRGELIDTFQMSK